MTEHGILEPKGTENTRVDAKFRLPHGSLFCVTRIFRDMKGWKEGISSGSKVSSKRVVTLVSFSLMAIGFLANLFFDFDIDTNIYD